MAAVLDQGDIAYALHSIRTTGGCCHDADILEALLEEDALPYLDAIRKGMSTAQAADELERMVWGKPVEPKEAKVRLVRHERSRDRHDAFSRLREKIARLRQRRLVLVSRNA